MNAYRRVAINGAYLRDTYYNRYLSIESDGSIGLHSTSTGKLWDIFSSNDPKLSTINLAPFADPTPFQFDDQGGTLVFNTEVSSP